MVEISVENMEPEIAPPAEAPEAPEVTPELPEPEQPVPAPPELERQPVAFQTAQGEEVSFAAAPKKRGRPKGKAKPKAEPKQRGRPPNPVPAEPVPEAPPAPQLDINQLLEPIFKAYMATSEMRKREAKRERYSTLFQGMVGM